jgi:hypothetical protein
VVIQSAVELVADFGGLGTKGRTGTLKEDHGDDVSVPISVGSEPAKARAVFGAGAGLAQDLFFTKVLANAVRDPVSHGAGHEDRDAARFAKEEIRSRVPE